MKTKICIKCSAVYSKPFEKWFYRAIGNKDGFNNRCKKCVTNRVKKYKQTQAGQHSRKKYENSLKCKLTRKRNAQRWRASKNGKASKRQYWLKSKYGLTTDEYNKIFEQQKGYCAICGIHQSELNGKPHVDHNHKTGEVRGLLCSKCNCSLAPIENIGFKIAAESYLIKYKD